jgi:hypothetical protein
MDWRVRIKIQVFWLGCSLVKETKDLGSIPAPQK